MNKGSEDDLRFDGAQMMPSRQPCSQQSEGHCSQKKKEQKENEEPSPVVDKPPPTTKLWKAATAPPAYPQPVAVPYTSLGRIPETLHFLNFSADQNYRPSTFRRCFRSDIVEARRLCGFPRRRGEELLGAGQGEVSPRPDLAMSGVRRADGPSTLEHQHRLLRA